MFGNERELVDEAFASNYIAPCGPMVERFELALAESVGVPHACALASGTAALDLLCHELRIAPGDTIFCSNLTFVASIAPAVHRGAVPVFIGSDEASWTISPSLLEEALEVARRAGKLPRAVVAVDLYGQCCDYAVLEELCQRYEVPLIVDAAEALGAGYCDHTVVTMERLKGLLQPQSGCNQEVKRGSERQAAEGREVLNSTLQPLGGCKKGGCKKGWRQAGDAGWAAIYSFNGNKIITSSGGGMLVSRDQGLIERACKRAQQSRNPKVWYEHSELGYNYRMSNIVAAIGLGQLMNLERIVVKKRRIFELYQERLGDLPGVEFMPEAAYGRCNRWLTVMRLKASGMGGGSKPGCPSALVLRVVAALEAANIEARPVWKPMHLQPVFAGSQVYGAQVDEEIFRSGICLPSGTGLSQDEIGRVADIVRGVVCCYSV